MLSILQDVELRLRMSAHSQNHQSQLTGITSKSANSCTVSRVLTNVLLKSIAISFQILCGGYEAEPSNVSANFVLPGGPKCQVLLEYLMTPPRRSANPKGIHDAGYCDDDGNAALCHICHC